MYYLTFIEANMTNAMTRGTDNFRTSTLSRHVKCEDHQAILRRQTKLAKVARLNALSEHDNAVISGMKVVYWLTKEALPFLNSGA